MLVLFLQTLLIFLFPLAVYCWLLGMINRRSHPMVVSGPWDFVGLLFAASGFLLLVGPALLSGCYYAALTDLPRRNLPQPLTTVFWELMAHRWTIWAAYYVLLVCGAVFLIWWRGRKTVVYNVQPIAFNRVLAETLDRLGSAWKRQGNRLQMRFAPLPAVHLETAFTSDTARPSGIGAAAPHRHIESSDQAAVLDVDSFPAMCNVTLHWRSASREVRDEVETELTRALSTVETEENGAGTWLLAVSTCLFGLMFVSVLAILVGATLAMRR